MTEKDKQNIINANLLPPAFHAEVYQMALEADTEEARQELLAISRRLYHQEEAQLGYE